MKKVTVTFLYDEVKGKDDKYYKDLVVDEIINDGLDFDSRVFEIEYVKE